MTINEAKSFLQVTFMPPLNGLFTTIDMKFATKAFTKPNTYTFRSFLISEISND